MDHFEARNKAYLQPFDLEKAKQRHETFAVELRKQKRVERYLQKRTHHQPEPHLSPPADQLEADPLVLSSSLLQTFKTATSPDHSRRLLMQIRRLCAVPTHPPLHLLAQVGVTGKLAVYLNSTDPEEVFAATWIFTNLASLTDDAVMREIGSAGVVGKLVTCLGHESENVVENGLWALGNYAGGEEHCREEVLAAGVLPAMEQLTRNPHSEDFCETFTWVLYMLAKTLPKPQHLPSLCHLLVQSLSLPYSSSLLNSLSGAYQLSVKDLDCVSMLVNVQAVPALLSLLSHSNLDVQFNSLRVAGNICAGTDKHTAVMLHGGLLEALCPVIEAKERNLRKEAFWLLSNVLASEKSQVEITVRHRCFAGVMKGLTDGDFSLRKEAIVCLGNVVSSKAEIALEVWGDMEGLERVCESLAAPDATLQKTAMDTIQEYVEMVKWRTLPLDDVMSRLEAAGALHQLECLLHHSSLQLAASHLLQSLHEDNSEVLCTTVPLLYQFS